MFKKYYARQFRRPSGLLGLYAANFMKKNNQDYFVRVRDLLEPEDNDTILEIGCGAGGASKLIVDKNAGCTVHAMDFSPLMLKKAGKTLREEVTAGRVRLLKGDFSDFEFGDAAYSKIFAINVVYFWNDLFHKFSKIHRLLKPGGRLVLFMSSPERLRTIPFAVDEVFNKYTVTQVETELVRAGFVKANHESVVKNGLDIYYVRADK